MQPRKPGKPVSLLDKQFGTIRVFILHMNFYVKGSKIIAIIYLVPGLKSLLIFRWYTLGDDH